MKTRTLTTLVCLLATTVIHAQEQRRQGDRQGGGQGKKNPIFTVLDANADGAIDATELAGAAAAIKKLDTNADGKITEDEARPPHGQGQGQGKGQMTEGKGGRTRPGADTGEMVTTLMAFDKNADGKLSKDEVPERMQGIFERGDKDKDGLLSADEVQAAAASQADSTPAQGGKVR